MKLLAEFELRKDCECSMCFKNKAQRILSFFWDDSLTGGHYRKSIESFCDDCYAREIRRYIDWLFVTKTFFDRYTSKYENKTSFTDRTV